MNNINGKSNMVYVLANDTNSSKKIIYIPINKVLPSEKIKNLFGHGSMNLHEIVKCCIEQPTTRIEVSTEPATLLDFHKFTSTCRNNGFVKHEHLLEKIFWIDGKISNNLKPTI